MSLVSIRNKTNQVSKGVIWIAAGALIIGTAGGTIFNGFFGAKNAVQSPQASSDDVIAKVNGTPIKRSDYDQALNRYRDQMSMYGGNMAGPMSAGELHVGALNQVIGQQLVLQIAAKQGLSASDADVDAERTKWMKEIKTQLGLPETATQSAVEAQLNKVGQTLDRIVPEEKLKAAALSDKYDAAVERMTRPSDAAVTSYYTGLHTEHILIDRKSRPDAQALDQAKKVIAQLNAAKSANFEALAKQYSDDPGTKAKGGDDGWINGQTGYVDEFMNGARTLKVGEWSQTPVNSPQFGYFVIKLLATRDDKPKDFAKKQDEYIKQIGSSATQKLRSNDMQAAQKAMKVEVADAQLNGDWQLMNAFKNAGQAGKPSPADSKAALDAYDKALKGNNDQIAVAQIQAQRAILFRIMDKPGDQLKALIAASNACGDTDSDIAMQIGELYKKTKDTTSALKYYQIASRLAFDNVGIHSQLQQSFKDLGKADLAAAEAKWVADYQARQKTAGGPGGMGGMPISVSPK